MSSQNNPSSVKIITEYVKACDNPPNGAERLEFFKACSKEEREQMANSLIAHGNVSIDAETGRVTVVDATR